MLDSCQEYRLFLLETMKENNDMEIDHSPYNLEVLRQVSNIISMLDILGFYPQLETRHYASLRKFIFIHDHFIEAFYRTYAYELLINNDITVFLNCIQKIIDIHKGSSTEVATLGNNIISKLEVFNNTLYYVLYNKQFIHSFVLMKKLLSNN